MSRDIFSVSTPVWAFTCGTDCIEKISGVMTVGGFALPEGGGAGGCDDDRGVAEDCDEPPKVVCVELLFKLDDGEFSEDIFDGELAPCVVDEPPIVEPELVVDVCAKT
jgi:hypothetical protein